MGDDKKNVKWGLAQRFEFIEWRAFWAGGVNRKDLEDEFGISTPHASVDFRSYMDDKEGNIVYNSTEKAYVTTAGFRPKYLNLSPERYLLQLQALKTDAIRKEDTWFDEVPSLDVVPTIIRGPQAFTLRAIVKAIEMKGSISVHYQSLSSTGVRTICPHALVSDGLRWHVRALAVEHGEYRDYSLSRIGSFEEPRPFGDHEADDIEWQRMVTLKIVAHPGLDSEQKSAIEYDFRLKDGELNIEMRAALAFYFIRRHNLDLRNKEIDAERLQISLQNYDEIEAQVAEAKAASKALIQERQRNLPAVTT